MDPWTHNHGHYDFLLDSHSNSHIEAFWSQLTRYLEKLNLIFHSKSFIYYIREGEFRCKLTGKTIEEIISNLFKMYKKVFDYSALEFSSEEEILCFNNYYY